MLSATLQLEASAPVQDAEGDDAIRTFLGPNSRAWTLKHLPSGEMIEVQTSLGRFNSLDRVIDRAKKQLRDQVQMRCERLRAESRFEEADAIDWTEA